MGQRTHTSSCYCFGWTGQACKARVCNEEVQDCTCYNTLQKACGWQMLPRPQIMPLLNTHGMAKSNLELDVLLAAGMHSSMQGEDLSVHLMYRHKARHPRHRSQGCRLPIFRKS